MSPKHTDGPKGTEMNGTEHTATATDEAREAARERWLKGHITDDEMWSGRWQY